MSQVSNRQAEEEQRSCFLVGAFTAESAEELQLKMEELKGLAEACELTVLDQFTQQLRKEVPATCIGSGKVRELRMYAEADGVDCFVFLNHLSPSQISNLSDALEAEILDRTALILEIFSKRARTAEAVMQVEYARLQYMLPRLVGLRKNLSRQGGAGGSMSSKGAGEQQIELDRRRIGKRMSQLRRSLDKIEKTRDVQRQKRGRSGVPVIALTGYTNAGKSTLLNYLVRKFGNHEEVLEKDMLFATLDTTMRRISVPANADAWESGWPRKELVIADTVGFISDLPHDLVKAFRSTLEEVRRAAVILIVADSSDKSCEEQIRVTRDTLRDLGVDGIPVITVMNKEDRAVNLPSAEARRKGRESGEKIWISARSGEGIQELIDMLCETLDG